MPFENPQADAALTRRSGRNRTAAFTAPAAGTTAPDSTDAAAAPTAASAPLSRRAVRERMILDLPTVPAAAESAPAAPRIPTPAELLTENAETPASLFEADTAAFESTTTDDGADAFEQASRAFRTVTGPLRTGSAFVPAEDIAAEAVVAHVVPRRRGSRKFLTIGATVGVMSLAGLLAVSMTLPAEAVAASQGTSVAATSLVAASGSEKTAAADDEIQAFVAPSGVQSESLARGDDFSTVSLVDVASEQGINYSNEIFTNDPEAAIQWPFMVGVGMSYGYGMRSGRLHEGIDFVPGNGAPVQAIADGTVRIATEQGGAYGVTVYIDHVIDGQVITSHYSHMQYGSLQVAAGDTVTVGTVVGKTGNTGRSYGAHMHFELIVNGSTIDPLPWLRENAGRYSY
ncbi:M23 family metallopeptidase [Microbacterium sp.]|uniref:M23 family metallopeptidase n=1 Tax=Microbacterium sp. TaxID=51671 RepID=UPI002FE03FA6